MNYLDIVKETTVDGDGLRLAIYLAGCENKCPGCFNPESWDYNAGHVLDEEAVEKVIGLFKANTLLDGISVLGGDPFAPLNRAGLKIFLERLWSEGIKDIWIWSGYTYEELAKIPAAAACFRYITVLVDGRFMEKLKSPGLKFRGSSNQRLIYFAPGSAEVIKIL